MYSTYLGYGHSIVGIQIQCIVKTDFANTRSVFIVDINILTKKVHINLTKNDVI